MVKRPVIKTEEFVLYLEEVDYNIFIHCDVNVKWSKSVKNRLNFAFKELRKNFYSNYKGQDYDLYVRR